MIEALGLLVAIAVGIGCRLADIPLPAPARFEGALLVVVTTLGVLAGGYAGS
jgi:XapX domain-containing protein